MVASVDLLQYLDRDFGERINESFNEPLVHIATDVRARVGFVCARVIDEFRVKVGEKSFHVPRIPRLEGRPQGGGGEGAISTFSCDIAYSDSPMVSRASA